MELDIADILKRKQHLQIFIFFYNSSYRMLQEFVIFCFILNPLVILWHQ